MAEGFAREYARGAIHVHSAGIMSAGVHRRAIAVMKELGIDISGQQSKEIDAGLLRKMDIVITLCNIAEEACPATPPEVLRLHWPVRDPVGTIGSEEYIMNDFRRARDEIEGKVRTLISDILRSG